MSTVLTQQEPSAPLRRLGIIAAPGWFDPTRGEFSRRHPDSIDVTQTILPPAGFDWSFTQIAGMAPSFESATRLLAEAGSQVIAQVGPAFAYQIGGDAAGARKFQQQLQQASGVPVILNGVAVLDALDAIGCQRVAVACPYYNPEWKAFFLRFLNHIGLEVNSFQGFVEQGIFPSQEAVDARHYRFTDKEVQDSIRRTAAAAPQAQAVLIGGSGVRTLNWIEDLQTELGLPLIAADFALYQSVMRIMGLPPNTRCKSP